MRGLLVVCALLLCVLNGGCAIYEKEVRNRGGYIDYLADEHWLKADSKKMRALRAFAIEVSLVRIASVSTKTVEDRDLLAQRIGSTTKRGKYVFGCAFSDNPLGADYPEPCFYYDSLMVDYSTALFDLAMLALPREDGRKLIDAVGGDIVNPLNVGAVIESLISIGRDAIKYGRIAGALYRDTQELEVQMWLASPTVDQSKIPANYVVTADKVEPLRLIYARGNDDMMAWREAINALRSQGLEPVPHTRFIASLAKILKYQCSLLTTTYADTCASGTGDILAYVPATNGGTAPQAGAGLFDRIYASRKSVIAAGATRPQAAGVPANRQPVRQSRDREAPVARSSARRPA